MVSIRTAPRTNGKVSDGLPKYEGPLALPHPAGIFISTRNALLIGVAIAAIILALVVQTTRLQYMPVGTAQSAFPALTTVYFYPPAPVMAPVTVTEEITSSLTPSEATSAPVDNAEITPAQPLLDLDAAWRQQSFETAVQTARALLKTPGTDAFRAYDNLEQAIVLWDGDPMQAIIRAGHAKLTAEAAQVVAASATTP